MKRAIRSRELRAWAFRTALTLSVALFAGCSPPVPGRLVYVDIDKVIGADPAPELAGAPLPQPKPPAPGVVVKQPGLPAVSTTDRTLQHLAQAKKLISENRNK